MAAFVHNPLNGPYPASKAGVWAMCDTFRLELRHQGVTVGSVHPTFFQTPMVDAVSANPAALRLMSNFKGFWRLAPIETVVDGTIRGIERRSAHVIIPRSLRPVALAPGLLGPLIARFGFRGNAIDDATKLATSAAAADQPSGGRTRDPRTSRPPPAAPTAVEPPAGARTPASAPSAGSALRRPARPGGAIRARR